MPVLQEQKPVTKNLFRAKVSNVLNILKMVINDVGQSF